MVCVHVQVIHMHHYIHSHSIKNKTVREIRYEIGPNASSHCWDRTQELLGPAPKADCQKLCALRIIPLVYRSAMVEILEVFQPIALARVCAGIIECLAFGAARAPPAAFAAPATLAPTAIAPAAGRF